MTLINDVKFQKKVLSNSKNPQRFSNLFASKTPLKLFPQSKNHSAMKNYFNEQPTSVIHLSSYLI